MPKTNDAPVWAQVLVWFLILLIFVPLIIGATVRLWEWAL